MMVGVRATPQPLLVTDIPSYLLSLLEQRIPDFGITKNQ